MGVDPKIFGLILTIGLCSSGLCSSALAASSSGAQAVAPVDALTVPYLNQLPPGQAPVLDGLLDSALESLPEQRFAHYWVFDNPPRPKAQVSFRIAYQADYLYLYLEAEGERLHDRKRAYLQGDGYRILFARPSSSGLSQEYLELNFQPSAADTDAPVQVTQTLSNLYGSQIYRPLEGSSGSVARASDGKIRFESLLAWDELFPFHPWSGDAMGMNLYFAKAVEDFTHGYGLVADEGIWDEEIRQRAYRPLVFAAPESERTDFCLLRPLQQHGLAGATIQLRASGFCGQNKTRSVELQLVNEIGESVAQQHFALKNTAIDKTQTLTWPLPDLPAGIYRWRSNNTAIHLPSVAQVRFPALPYAALVQTVKDNAAGLSIGAVESLLFHLQQAQTAQQNLPDDLPGAQLYQQQLVLMQDYLHFHGGKDPYQARRGPYRRGFRSSLDSSLQPYSVKLPQDYDPQQTYPLLVFLHGSGQDEQKLLQQPRSDGSWIEIAPLARDLYRAYTSPESQRDISDAIAAAVRDFSVDEKRIVIGGFSMGGYGALRAFYEHPQRYAGVVVHAGHPNLAVEWLGGVIRIS